MRKVTLVSALVCGMSVVAGAQTRLTGKLTCSKPSVTEAAGDGASVIMFNRANCTWPQGFTFDGTKPSRVVDASIAEGTGANARDHGYSTTVYENGDTTIVRYEGTAHMNKDRSSTFKGTWRFTHGSGKFQGITGSGTFSGGGKTDGTADINVNGHYSIAKAKAKPKK